MQSLRHETHKYKVDICNDKYLTSCIDIKYVTQSNPKKRLKGAHGDYVVGRMKNWSKKLPLRGNTQKKWCFSSFSSQKETLVHFPRLTTYGWKYWRMLLLI